jgi:hypothetical protein
MTPSGAISGNGPSKLLSAPLTQRRDTAAGCRERAASSMAHAVTMVSASDRRAIEDNSASWSAQAAILQRLEDVVRDAEMHSTLPLTPSVIALVTIAAGLAV